MGRLNVKADCRVSCAEKLPRASVVACFNHSTQSMLDGHSPKFTTAEAGKFEPAIMTTSPAVYGPLGVTAMLGSGVSLTVVGTGAGASVVGGADGATVVGVVVWGLESVGGVVVVVGDPAVSGLTQSAGGLDVPA